MMTVLIRTLEDAEAEKAGVFDGYRSIKLMSDGELQFELPLLGDDVATQQDSLERFANAMDSGQDELADLMNRCVEIDPSKLPEIDQSFASLGDRVLYQLFSGADNMMYDETPVFEVNADGATLLDVQEFADCAIELIALVV